MIKIELLQAVEAIFAKNLNDEDYQKWKELFPKVFESSSEFTGISHTVVFGENEPPEQELLTLITIKRGQLWPHKTGNYLTTFKGNVTDSKMEIDSWENGFMALDDRQVLVPVSSL